MMDIMVIEMIQACRAFVAREALVALARKALIALARKALMTHTAAAAPTNADARALPLPLPLPLILAPIMMIEEQCKSVGAVESMVAAEVEVVRMVADVAEVEVAAHHRFIDIMIRIMT
jgi:hypothetical protein